MTKVRLGLAVSLSGRYALLGRQVHAGVRAFIAYANEARSRVRARDLPAFELEVVDDESDESCLQAALAELLDQREIDILLGPYGSGLGLKAARFAHQREFVLWNHSSSADRIFDPSFQWTVGVITPASRYLNGIIDLVQSTDPAVSTAAIVSADTGFARDMAAGVSMKATRSGLSVNRHEYPTGIDSFADIIAALFVQQPELILAVGRVEDDLRFTEQLIKADPPCRARGTVVAAIDRFKQRFGLRAEGFLAPSQWEPDARYAPDFGPDSHEFLRYFRTISDEPVDYPAAQGFAGALIASRCIEIAGSLVQRELREAARDLEGMTFYGPYAIDRSTGSQLGHRMLVTQWQDGEKKIVWPRTVANSTVRYRDVSS